MDLECEQLNKYLIGKRCKANHPITCLNPEETFIIKEVIISPRGEKALLFLRGENTCWFSSYTILD